MASALARLCSRAWRQQLQHQHQQYHRLAGSVVVTSNGPQPQAATASAFHTSAPVPMGRKGGASAFEKRLPPSAFRAKAAHLKRVQQQDQEQRRRQAQRTQKRTHPGNRGGSVLPALSDPGQLIDPDFGDMIRELLRPVEDASAAPSSSQRRIGRRENTLSLLEAGEGEGPVSKEEVLARVDVKEKRAEMAAREAETGLPCPLEEYDRLIRAYGVQDRPEEAVGLLREMQDRGLPLTPKSLTAAVYALCRAHPAQPEAAEALMVEMEGAGLMTPDTWTWATLIKGYVRAGKADEALGAFKRMKLAGHQQDLAVCTAVLEALGRQAAAGGDSKAATEKSGKERMLDFWMDMRLNGVEPDAVAYTVMMKALVKTGDVERALSFLDEMEQMGVEPTIVTYNTAILAAAEAPLWFPGYNSYVYELLGRLEGANLAPNPDTYRALLRLCAQAGNPLLAERYLEQMQLDQGLEPGREHYHALLHAYAMAQSAGSKGGRIPKLRGVGKGEEDESGIVSIAGTRLGPGNGDVEIDLKAAAKARALLPAEGKRSRKRALREALARGLQQEEAAVADGAEAGDGKQGKGKGRVDPSSLLLRVEGEEEVGAAPPTAAALAVAGAEEGSLVKSEGEGGVVLRGGLLHLLPSERERLTLDGLMPLEEGEREVDIVRARLPRGVLVTELQEANIRAAHAVLREMRARGLEPTTETMNHVLSVYAEALRIRRARQLVEEQFAHPKSNTTSSGSTPANTSGGDTAALVPIMGREGLPPVPADAKTYQIVVRMLVRAKRMGEAFELVKALPREKGIVPSAITLGIMAEALGRRGEIKPALHLIEVMREDLGYEPKEWHLRPLRRAMQTRGLRHPLVPADPKAWLKEGLQMRRQPDKAGRRVRNLVSSQMRAGN